MVIIGYIKGMKQLLNNLRDNIFLAHILNLHFHYIL